MMMMGGDRLIRKLADCSSRINIILSIRKIRKWDLWKGFSMYLDAQKDEKTEKKNIYFFIFL